METTESKVRKKHRRALILGFGYVGSQVGQLLVDQGVEVWAVSRSNSQAVEAAQKLGIQWYAADLTQPGSLDGLEGPFDDVLFTASSSRGAMEDYEAIYCKGLINVMDWLTQTSMPRRFVYLSSTGVYGQNNGEWVDETMPVEPLSNTGKILVQAEQLVFDRFASFGLPGMVLRLSGIYGPDRGYALKRILNGDAVIEKPGNRWVNMIHRDDATMAVQAVLEGGKSGEIYNVSDDAPVRQSEFYEWLARKAGRPHPPWVDMDPLKSGKRRVTSKRISNAKISKLEHFQLRYPTYREGYLPLVQ